MNAHTPTPWGVTTINGLPAVGSDTEEGGLVAHCLSAADAALIVRAVNSHADLLAALEALTQECADGPPSLGTMARACAILARARGTP